METPVVGSMATLLSNVLRCMARAVVKVCGIVAQALVGELSTSIEVKVEAPLYPPMAMTAPERNSVVVCWARALTKEGPAIQLP